MLIKSLVCFFSSVVVLLSSAHAIGPGDKAPEFAPPGESATTLSSAAGKLIYLDFWASWCAPCHLSFPWMEKIQKEYGSSGLQVVTVNVDTKEAEVAKFLEKTKSSLTVLRDPDGVVAERFEVGGMPSSFLIDESGKILAVFHGFSAAESKAAEDAIRTALKREQLQ